MSGIAEQTPLLSPLPFEVRRRLHSVQSYSSNCISPRSSQLFHTGMPTKRIDLLQLRKTGECLKISMSQEEFINSLSDYKLPFRDLRLLLKSTGSLSRTRHPALLPRPSSSCFIFEMEQIKLLCFSDHCLIMNPEEKATQKLIYDLKTQFPCGGVSHVTGDRLTTESSMRLLYQKSTQSLDFEHVVLENALENIVGKFRKHLQGIKPALETLLHQVELNPETNGLKRLLAVKKSLAEFELQVEHVMKVIRSLLADDADMLSLYLSRPHVVEGDQEEVELLLSSYLGDLDEVETEIKMFIDMIEDTDQFISAHLDSARNEIIKLSLFIEVGGLVLAFGGVVSGLFGMNLSNKMEDNPWAFLLVCSCIFVGMIIVSIGFTTKYRKLNADKSCAQNFTALKNFFTYVADFDNDVLSKKTEKCEFKEAVEKLTGLKITDRESEYLFKMVNANKAVLNDHDKLNLYELRHALDWLNKT